MEAIIDSLRSLDWEDLDEVEAATRNALTALMENPPIIRRVLLALPEQPGLLRL